MDEACERRWHDSWPQICRRQPPSEVIGQRPVHIQKFDVLVCENTNPLVRAERSRLARKIPSALVLLRDEGREKLTARNVNKHRQVLAAMFGYACRADTYGLAMNPVAGTDKRREAPPARLDYYEVEEVEALARVCERGEHRPTRAIGEEEIEARAARLLRWRGSVHATISSVATTTSSATGGVDDLTPRRCAGAISEGARSPGFGASSSTASGTLRAASSRG